MQHLRSSIMVFIKLGTLADVVPLERNEKLRSKMPL